MASNEDLFDSCDRGQIMVALFVGGIKGFRFIFSPAYRARVLRVWWRKPDMYDPRFLSMFAGVIFYIAAGVLIVVILVRS